MGFLLLLVILAVVAFVAGAFFRDQVFSYFESTWFKATSSQEQRIWFSANGRSYTTFAEARAAWYETGSRDAEKDREKARRRYDEFLRGMERTRNWDNTPDKKE